MKMADELEGNTPSARSRTAKPKPVTPKATPEKPKRKSAPPTITDDLTGKFLRVGNKLYRTSDDKTPIVRIAGDRLKTSNIDALPDIIQIAKANGWTSIKVGGGDKFRKAAFLAAAARGLAVENYWPTKLALLWQICDFWDSLLRGSMIHGEPANGGCAACRSRQAGRW
jgi:hypothetical protein